MEIPGAGEAAFGEDAGGCAVAGVGVGADAVDCGPCEGVGGEGQGGFRGKAAAAEGGCDAITDLDETIAVRRTGVAAEADEPVVFAMHDQIEQPPRPVVGGCLRVVEGELEDARGRDITILHGLAENPLVFVRAGDQGGEPAHGGAGQDQARGVDGFRGNHDIRFFHHVPASR